MGMPIITSGTGTRTQASIDLLESVALQETALSHILNAEGEKMQAIIAMPGISVKILSQLNKSVNKVINTVARLEMVLQSKLELLSGNNDNNNVPQPTLTSPTELAKIHAACITISVPFTDPLAPSHAEAATAAIGQSKVAAGYKVTFTHNSYNPGPETPVPDFWIMTGSFTVSKIGELSDTATSPSLKTIVVTSSASSASAAL